LSSGQSKQRKETLSQKKKKKKKKTQTEQTKSQKYYASQVPVVSACNPSYLGGRDWEDLGLRPDKANSL
jgi:hypothetical protein